MLLPLAPTIASTIADCLQSIAQKLNLDSLQKNSARDVIELQPDLDWQGQFQRSIRQIPTSQYQYVSTIAHQLAAKSALTPLEICQNLDLSISALAGLGRSADLKLDCWYNKGSYIYFQLTPKSIEIWLNYIQDLPLGQLVTATSIPPGSILQGSGLSANDLAIYAHARCCSLLKLAATAKIVRLTTDWQISTPNWLLDDAYVKNRLTTESNCIFEHPAEQQLIQTLMAVLDTIYGQISAGGSNGHRKSPNWTKLTIELAQSWLEFDRYCHIFSRIEQNSRRSMARCGLTAISRRYLQVLLENYLAVPAAEEL